MVEDRLFTFIILYPLAQIGRNRTHIVDDLAVQFFRVDHDPVNALGEEVAYHA